MEQPPRPAPDPRATGERIDSLLDAAAAGGPVARERSEELVRLVADLYGAGLERLLDILYEAGRLDDGVLALLARDELVSGLLLVHGLHPYGVETRVEQALESVRPYLGSHGGDVELLGVSEDGTVRLRMLGSCDGCPSSSVTLELAVEDAIEAAAPEVTAIEVEAASPVEPVDTPLIPVESLRSRLGAASGEQVGGWHEVPDLADLPAGAVTTAVVGGVPLLVCRVGEQRYAFRDRCARCEAGLAGAGLDPRDVLRCPSCGAPYDVRRAGACLDVPDLHLDPLPLLVGDRAVSVAVPAPLAT